MKRSQSSTVPACSIEGAAKDGIQCISVYSLFSTITRLFYESLQVTHASTEFCKVMRYFNGSIMDILLTIVISLGFRASRKLK